MGPQAKRKSKAPDKRPARERYWKRKTLQKRKTRRIARNMGITLAEALDIWLHHKTMGRKGRVKGGMVGLTS